MGPARGRRLPATNLFQLRAGYRILDIDCEDGGGFSKFGLEATFHGPWLGFTFVS